MNESNKKQIVLALLGSLIYSFTKIILFAIGYNLWYADFGIDVHMNFFKAHAILYAFMIGIFYTLLGH